MFWRRSREAAAALDRMHPVHQLLVRHRVLSTAQNRAGWEALLASLGRHQAEVPGRRWALPPRTFEVLVPLLDLLCQDLDARGVLSVTADLRGPRDATGRRGLPVRPPVRSATEWWTVDPWLTLNARLGDGSVLRVSVVDRVRHREVVKRSRSGKTKTKRKTKEVQVIRVSRALPRGARGQRPASRPPQWMRVRVRDGARVAVAATAKLNRLPRGPEQVDSILLVAAEPFRWTERRPAA